MTGKRPAKIMISAGESSGETHGAALVRAAQAQGRPWRFFGLGGDRMAAAGVRLLGHIRETAVMGLVEILGSLRRLAAARRRLKLALELERPDLLLLIDAPDFNLSLARHASNLGIAVVYYICPSVWAWRAGRLKTLAAHTRRRVVLFPFEREFHAARGVSADWLGHPILDELPPPRPAPEAKISLGLNPEARLLALLPGSRRTVAARLAPVFLRAADLLLDRDPGLNLVLPRAATLRFDDLAPCLAQAPPRVRERLRIIDGRSLETLAAADLALLASGTASVEATCLGTPQVVAYKIHPLSWLIARRLVTIPYATIANLAAGREIVPELLQDQATPELLAARAWPLLADPEIRAQARADLARVRAGLGGPGASSRLSDLIAEELAGAGGP